jgi:hypothetical protein
MGLPAAFSCINGRGARIRGCSAQTSPASIPFLDRWMHSSRRWYVISIDSGAILAGAF